MRMSLREKYNRMNDRIGMKNKERSVIIVGLVSGLALFGDSMLYVVLPVYWKEVGLTSLWQVGLILSINRFIRLPLNPLIGWLYHRMTLRTGLFVAVILGAATTIGYGIWKGFIAWIIHRAIWGIAWSLMRMGGYLTVIGYSDDSNRGKLMGRYNGVWRLGTLVGVLFGGLMVPIVGLQSVAILFGLLALVGLPLIAISIAPGRASGTLHTQKADGNRAVVWTPQVKKIVMSGLAISMLHAVFGSTLSYVIESNYSRNELFLGIVISSTALAGVLQAIRCLWEPFLATWVGQRSDGPKGRLPLFLLSLAAAAVGYALLPLQLPPLVWLLTVIYVMATSTFLTTITDAMATDAARNSSVIKVMTAYSVSTDLGAAIGPTLIYWVLGSQNGLLTTYIVCSAIFLLIAWWYRKESILERRLAG